MTIQNLDDYVKNSKFRIICAECQKAWIVGDRERTDEEKKIWLCPDCIKEIRARESKAEELEQEAIQSPKEEPTFYQD